MVASLSHPPERELTPTPSSQVALPATWRTRTAQDIGNHKVSDTMRRKASSFEEYWLMSKAWERRGLSLGTARALVNAGFLTVDDLYSADDLELATVPRVGPKSLALLYGLMGREMSDAPRMSGKRQQLNRPPRQLGMVRESLK
jgi:hypothetical protein